MVLGLIIEIGIRASFWCLYKTYRGIHYLYYGPQETSEDRIMREIKLIKQENIELRKNLGLHDMQSSLNHDMKPSMPQIQPQIG